MGDTMTKEVNGVTTKLAFGDVNDQAILLKSLEQQAKMFFACPNILASHQHVIDVNKGEVLTATDSVHQVLESLGSIL